MSGSIKAVSAFSKIEKEEFSITPEQRETFINSHSKKQQEFLRCKEQNILFYGGRRAGKTLAVSSMIFLLDLDLPMDGDIFVVSSTLDKVRALYWKNLTRLKLELGLDWEFRSGENRIITPKREIYFHGLRDIHSADLAIGRKIAACIVEEGHTIRNDILTHYMKSAVRPCLIEFPESYKMIFALNPPIGRLEYLHQIYVGDEFKKIRITSKDNPHPAIQKNFKKHLEREARIDGYASLKEAMKTPRFQRTVLGQWVYENNRLVIDVDKLDTFEGNPPGKKDDLTTVIGVDFGGGRSYHAVVVLQYSKYSEKVYCVEEWQAPSGDKPMQELGKTINSYFQRYTHNGKMPRISVDTGGQGSVLLAELRHRYCINVPTMIPAKKREKVDYLKLMQTEAHTKRLLFRKGQSLLMHEFPQIFFTEDFLKVDEKNSLHSDLLDACLYSYKLIRNYLPEVKEKKKSMTEILRQEREDEVKRAYYQSKRRYAPRNKKLFLKMQ